MGHPLDYNACVALLQIHDQNGDGLTKAPEPNGNRDPNPTANRAVGLQEEFTVAHAHLKSLITPTIVVPFTSLRIPRSLYIALGAPQSESLTLPLTLNLNVVLGTIAVLFCGVLLLFQRFQNCPCELCRGPHHHSQQHHYCLNYILMTILFTSGFDPNLLVFILPNLEIRPAETALGRLTWT